MTFHPIFFWLFVFCFLKDFFVLFWLCTNWIWNDWNIYLICALKICISLTEPDAFQGRAGAGEAGWREVKEDGEVQDGAEAATWCEPLPKGMDVGSERMPWDLRPRWVLWKSWFSLQQIPGLMGRCHLLALWGQAYCRLDGDIVQWRLDCQFQAWAEAFEERKPVSAPLWSKWAWRLCKMGCWVPSLGGYSDQLRCWVLLTGADGGFRYGMISGMERCKNKIVKYA